MEVIMKPFKSILILSISVLVLASCSSSLQQRQVADDLYYAPNQNNNTQKSEIVKELEKDYENATANAEKYKELDTVADMKKSNPYDELLVNDMNEAYDRRQKALADPYYGMNYIPFSDQYWYASHFDPYLYNTIRMGSSVWVEPRWMSSMYTNYYYGSPYSYNSWGFGFSPFYSYGSYGYNPYNYGYGFGGYGYGYGYSYSYSNSPFGYNSFYGYGYYPVYGNYKTSDNRKYPYRTVLSDDYEDYNTNITRYYKQSDQDKRAAISTKGKGDKIRTIRRASIDDGKKKKYIRRAERKDVRTISHRQYDNRGKNSAKRYITNNTQDNSSRTTRRYYRRPDNKSNFNKIVRSRSVRSTRSDNSSGSHTTVRNYNSGNSSYSNSNSSSSSSRSTSSSSSSSSRSSSSGRKNR
jgi:hypothetical protein